MLSVITERKRLRSRGKGKREARREREGIYAKLFRAKEYQTAGHLRRPAEYREPRIVFRYPPEYVALRSTRGGNTRELYAPFRAREGNFQLSRTIAAYRSKTTRDGGRGGRGGPAGILIGLFKRPTSRSASTCTEYPLGQGKLDERGRSPRLVDFAI